MLKQIRYIWQSLRGTTVHHLDRRGYRYACQQVEMGNKQGQFLLARQYEEGNSAVKQDWVNAYVLYYLAAQQGLKEAKQKLQSLEPKLLAEQWQQAQAIIQKMKTEKEQGSE